MTLFGEALLRKRNLHKGDIMSKRRKRCYFCGAPATTSEHVPPKQMFKKFNPRSVVVPSCVSHNNAKSNSDASIIVALLRSYAMSTRAAPIDSDIVKAIDIAKPSVSQVSRWVTTGKVWTGLDRELVHIGLPINIRLWMSQVSAGLVYKALGRFEESIDWGTAVAYSPGWIPTDEPTLQESSYLLENRLLAENFWQEVKNLTWRLGWVHNCYPERIYQRTDSNFWERRNSAL
jgi:hypothetical protein